MAVSSTDPPPFALDDAVRNWTSIVLVLLLVVIIGAAMFQLTQAAGS